MADDPLDRFGQYLAQQLGCAGRNIPFLVRRADGKVYLRIAAPGTADLDMLPEGTDDIATSGSTLEEALEAAVSTYRTRAVMNIPFHFLRPLPKDKMN